MYARGILTETTRTSKCLIDKSFYYYRFLILCNICHSATLFDNQVVMRCRCVADVQDWG